jgi:hypothetical protein
MALCTSGTDLCQCRHERDRLHSADGLPEYWARQGLFYHQRAIPMTSGVACFTTISPTKMGMLRKVMPDLWSRWRLQRALRHTKQSLLRWV